MSEKFKLDRKIGFQNTFYTKCINFIIDNIGPSIILRSICIQIRALKRADSITFFLKTLKSIYFSWEKIKSTDKKPDLCYANQYPVPDGNV